MANEITKRIRAARTSIGWELEDAADFLGLKPRGYQAREQKGEFPLTDIARLAERFGVSLDFLLTGKENHEPLSELRAGRGAGARGGRCGGHVAAEGLINY